jgi:hypothetical protein
MASSCKLVLVVLLGAFICTSTSARKLVSQKGTKLSDQNTFFGEFPGYGGGLGGGGGGGFGGGGGGGFGCQVLVVVVV